MSKIDNKKEISANLRTVGFQYLGFLIGAAFGAGVVIMIIHVVRMLCESTGV